MKYDYPTKPAKTETVKAHGYCEDCDFEVFSGNAVGLVAQHAGATGHTCHVEITQKHKWQKGVDIKTLPSLYGPNFWDQLNEAA